jgi:uncharacterized protein YaaW (UPF0174 family)
MTYTGSVRAARGYEAVVHILAVPITGYAECGVEVWEAYGTYEGETIPTLMCLRCTRRTTRADAVRSPDKL